MTAIRPTAVAGRFYPENPRELEASVRRYLAEAEANHGPVPKAVIAPHAGYVYSGPVAASAYARLLPARGRITRVVLLGPCHRVPVRGLALSGAKAFATPLGDIPLDQETCARLAELPQVEVFDASHAHEHSLEVHLPFLQIVLGRFALVPLAVGDATEAEVAEALDRAWGGPETLIVVSSDLSHYLPYDEARALDAATCSAIEHLDGAAIGRDQACGRAPVKGLLALAKKRGLKVATVDLRNSGDTAGPRDQVVGYGAWLFFEDASGSAKKDGDGAALKATRALLGRHGRTLIGIAAKSIAHGLAHDRPAPVRLDSVAEELRGPGAAFVTLKRNGRLRGCIGSAEAHRPLAADVAENAYRAAFKDPRFPRLTKEEKDGLDLSVSVLTTPEPMSFRDQSDLLAQLRPGTDGLIIADGRARALYLPSVWEQLPEAQTFLAQLKLKAGLAADHWSAAFRAHRFAAAEIKGVLKAEGG
ncbi:MAG: AmmeMemoRadiSam system protein B [Rhodospirillales bacterium]|nr:AmmeMemoRadiSam system protein B [Rhodospirillales bacterium]